MIIKNAAVLLITSVILRSFGLLLKIYLADILGSGGLGLYQLIMSVYIFASSFASSGICTAVTKKVAESDCDEEIKHTVKTAFFITTAVAVLSVGLLNFGADFIAKSFIKDETAAFSLKIISVALTFVGYSSVLRGFFIAKAKTVQPSVVQIVEQTVRICLYFLFLNFFQKNGVKNLISAIVLGDTLAEIVSFLLIFVLYRKSVSKIKCQISKKGTANEIIRVALPISGSSYLSSLLHTAENLLVPIKLSAFHKTADRSLSLFGAVKGMAMPILFFPASFLSSLSIMLLPEISCAKARNNTLKIKETVKKSISYTLTLSIFTAFVFLNLGFELGEIVYNDSDVGFVLKVLAPIVPFMYLESIASGILKGLDRQVQMFIYNLADSGARLLAVFFLVPVFGIKAYLGIMICSNSFTSLLCYKNLKNATKIDTDYLNWIIKPSILGVLGIIASANFKKQMNSLILKTVACILVQSVVFFLPIFIGWIFKNKEKSKIKPADF